MINKAPGYPTSNQPHQPHHGPTSRQQPPSLIRRGTAQRLGLHQPPRPGITTTRTALRFATIQTGKKACNWAKAELRGMTYDEFATGQRLRAFIERFDQP